LDDKKPAKKKKAAFKPEFTGYITSIACAKAGSELRFAVAGKKNASRNYQLAGAAPAIVTLITAAYVSGKKVTVMDALASEIHVGAKPKAVKIPKIKAEKKPKRIKGPALEAVPAA
jgi:hypothetical protein